MEDDKLDKLTLIEISDHINRDIDMKQFLDEHINDIISKNEKEAEPHKRKDALKK